MNKHKPDCQLSWIAFPHTSVEHCTYCNPSIENEITDIVAFAASGFICHVDEGFGCSCNRKWRDKQFVRDNARYLAQEIIKKVREQESISFCVPEAVEPEKPEYITVEFDYSPKTLAFVHVDSKTRITQKILNLPYEEIYVILENAGIEPMYDLIDQLREFNEDKSILSKTRVSFTARRISL